MSEQLQTSADTDGLDQFVQNVTGENPVRDVILQRMNISLSDRVMLPKLNAVNKKVLQRCVDEVNSTITEIPTNTLEATNNLVYAAAARYVCDSVDPRTSNEVTS